MHHGTVYRVLSVKTSRAIGSGFFRETTSGRFVIVRVRMTNLKTRPSTILATNLAIRTRSRVKYGTTDKAFYVKNALSLLENLQPQLPVEKLLIYELPARMLRGAKLEINDSGTGDKARIALGL